MHEIEVRGGDGAEVLELAITVLFCCCCIRHYTSAASIELWSSAMIAEKTMRACWLLGSLYIFKLPLTTVHVALLSICRALGNIVPSRT